MARNRSRTPTPLPPLRRPERGQTISEFALTAPLLFALLVGLLLVAWIGFAYVTVNNAARMGARHLLTYPTIPRDTDTFGSDVDAEVTYIVTRALPMLNWHRAVVTISPHVEDRDPPWFDEAGNRRYWVQVSVRVQYPMNLPTVRIPYVVREGSFFLLPPISITATSRMRLE
jgi:Flp pilus assembly protein TadG